jgi:hypothetical protein
MTSTATLSTQPSPATSNIASSPVAPPPEQALLDEAQAQLFSSLIGDAPLSETPAIFILGSPRTGSTLLYQGLAHYLRLPYFSNLANYQFPCHPVLAAPTHHQVLHRIDLEFTSAYGKTVGAFQPSEASAIFRNWFGGDHPSQVNSATILPGKENHLLKTMAVIHRVFSGPLVTKNPWNCFRIADLARLLSSAFFLWIRRDIAQSALSDLAARYVVQGNPLVWNSATPASIEALRKLPYWAQVVENQFEFAEAIQHGLARHAPRRHVQVWYEDFIANPTGTLDRVAAAMSKILPCPSTRPLVLGRAPRSTRAYPESDEVALRSYVAEHEDRLRGLGFDGRRGTSAKGAQ